MTVEADKPGQWSMICSEIFVLSNFVSIAIMKKLLVIGRPTAGLVGVLR